MKNFLFWFPLKSEESGNAIDKDNYFLRAYGTIL